MPNRVQWSSSYSMGHKLLDTQHQHLLTQCNALADCLASPGPESDLKFDAIFETLMARAGEHFAAEAALLAQCGAPLLEEHQNEHEEFEYLAHDIVTTENFERIELQRFLALWWVGHIVDSGKKYRASLATLPDA